MMIPAAAEQENLIFSTNKLVLPDCSPRRAASSIIYGYDTVRRQGDNPVHWRANLV